MRRLRQLTMRRNIFTTRVTIVISGTDMMVYDAETNAVMEQFPLSMIYRPTAVTSDTAGDMYNNVVVLIVLGDEQQMAPEVHIFQCLKQRASTLLVLLALCVNFFLLCLAGGSTIFNRGLPCPYILSWIQMLIQVVIKI